jgi:hypothetical protein
MDPLSRLTKVCVDRRLFGLPRTIVSAASPLSGMELEGEEDTVRLTGR